MGMKMPERWCMSRDPCCNVPSPKSPFWACSGQIRMSCSVVRALTDTHAHTHTHTDPILLPRPLTREVKIIHHHMSHRLLVSSVTTWQMGVVPFLSFTESGQGFTSALSFSAISQSWKLGSLHKNATWRWLWAHPATHTHAIYTGRLKNGGKGESRFCEIPSAMYPDPVKWHLLPGTIQVHALSVGINFWKLSHV